VVVGISRSDLYCWFNQHSVVVTYVEKLMGCNCYGLVVGLLIIILFCLCDVKDVGSFSYVMNECKCITITIQPLNYMIITNNTQINEPQFAKYIT